jgi:hypothetical protein
VEWSYSDVLKLHSKFTQDQIDIYAGRGLLVQSDRAWLWGTSVEHCVLYQYQLSGAKNILMSMIQTESPYFQPVPVAPQPFTPGLFPNDPTFTGCTGGGCYFSWAIRIVDSTTVYILGSGLYSWFSDYSQTCLLTGNCQEKGFEVVQSFDLWVYNLCTKAIVQMVSPLGAVPTLATNNVNGFLSSILAWLQGAEEVTGPREFVGFQVYTLDNLDDMVIKYPQTCRTALTQLIVCDPLVESFSQHEYHGSLSNDTVTNSVCDAGCGASLQSWFDNVEEACDGSTLDDGSLPTLLGGRMLNAYREVCLKDTTSGEYCNGRISNTPPPAFPQLLDRGH